MSGKTYIVFLVSLLLAFGAWNTRAYAAPGPLQAVLDWGNPDDTTDKIQVEKGISRTGTFTGTFASMGQLPPSTITFVDSLNSPGDTACYRIAYVNASGVGPYAGPVCKTFPALPTQTPEPFTVK